MTTSFRPRGVSAAALLALPLLGLALPAGATTPAAAPFGPAQVTCVQKVSGVADGTVYGAGSCGGTGIRHLVRRPGAAWRDNGLAWPDKRLEAVAADETATFVVMSCTSDQKGCATADPLGKDWYIGKIPHGGRPSALTSLGGTEFANDEATVAARGGRWWAVLGSTVKDRDQPGTGSQTLFFRKTLGGNGAGPVPTPADPRGRTFSYSPSIALTDRGASVAFITQVDAPDHQPQLQLATAGADGRFTTSRYEPAADVRASSPDIAVSGNRTYLAWNRDGSPALGLGQGPEARRVDLVARGQVGRVSVAASGGQVTVSTSETFAYQGQQTTRVYARTLDSTGASTGTAELSAAAGRQDPAVRAGLEDSTAARGKATVAFSTGSSSAGRTSTSTQR